jgi:hypothetical protein
MFDGTSYPGQLSGMTATEAYSFEMYLPEYAQIILFDVRAYSSWSWKKQ